MYLFSRVLLPLLAGCATLTSGVTARQITKDEIKARQLEAAKRWNLPSPQVKRDTVKNITFSNPKAKGASEASEWSHNEWLTILVVRTEFYVDGATIPEVDFDVGPSWSGLMPISGNANETRKVCSHHGPSAEYGIMSDCFYKL